MWTSLPTFFFLLGFRVYGLGFRGVCRPLEGGGGLYSGDRKKIRQDFFFCRGGGGGGGVRKYSDPYSVGGTSYFGKCSSFRDRI